jgi:hypothetical protein
VGDTKAMARDVLDILTTPGKRDAMGQLARVKAEQFAMAAVVDINHCGTKCKH